MYKNIKIITLFATERKHKTKVFLYFTVEKMAGGPQESRVVLPNHPPSAPLFLVAIHVHDSYVWRWSFHWSKFLKVSTTLNLLTYCLVLHRYVSGCWLISLHGPRVKQMFLLILFICFHLSAFCDAIHNHGMLQMLAYHYEQRVFK